MTILDNIMAGIIAALLIAFGIVLVMNANLRADLARADANAVTLSRVNADLKSAAEKQNQAVVALQAMSDAKTHAAEKAEKAAAVEAHRAEAQAALIAKQPVTNTNDCEAATQILRDYLKAR